MKALEQYRSAQCRVNRKAQGTACLSGHRWKLGASLLAGTALALFISGLPTVANEAVTKSEFRTFTNKQGQQIEAEVIGVGGSMRTVTIQRPDQKRFEIEIVSLSLDDQQFLKDWLQAQPAPDPSNLNLQLEAESALTEATRERFDDRIYNATGTRAKLLYHFAINNLSREPLVDVELEYAILLHDLVQIREADPNVPEQVRWRARSEGPVIYRSGSIQLGVLKYNTEISVDSASVDHEEVRSSSSSAAGGEDLAIGILARLVGADGTVLATYSDIDRNYPQLTWNSFTQRRDQGESEDGRGLLVESVATR